MWRKIQEVHPTLAEVGKFIDWKSYRLKNVKNVSGFASLIMPCSSSTAKQRFETSK